MSLKDKVTTKKVVTIETICDLCDKNIDTNCPYVGLCSKNENGFPRFMYDLHFHDDCLLELYERSKAKTE